MMWRLAPGGQFNELAEAPDGTFLAVQSSFRIWRFTASGEIISIATLPRSLYDTGLCVAFGQDGISIIGGTYDVSNGIQNAYIVAISRSGQVIWDRVVDFGINEGIGNLAVDANGSITVAVNPRYYSWNGLVARFSPLGELEWSVDLGDGNVAGQVHLLPNGDVISNGLHQFRVDARPAVTRIANDGRIVWRYRDFGSLGRYPNMRLSAYGTMQFAGLKSENGYQRSTILFAEMNLSGSVLRSYEGDPVFDSASAIFRSDGFVDYVGTVWTDGHNDVRAARFSWLPGPVP